MKKGYHVFLGLIMGIGLTFGMFMVMLNDDSKRILSRNSKEITTSKTTITNNEATPKRTKIQSCPATANYPVARDQELWKEFENAVQSVQAERQIIMRKACQAMKKNECFSFPTTPNPAAMTSKTYPLSVCEIYKCGSSTWLFGILKIDEPRRKAVDFSKQSAALVYGKNRMRVKTDRNETEQQKYWDNSTNIITVRNPFARIVSAYLDKMIPTSKGFTYVYGPMSKRIWSKFRHLRANPLERNSTDDGGTASFEDFVNSLVVERHNPHWTRFNVQCDPCAYHYDYIVKFETLQSDIAYLENHLNFSKEHKDVLFPMSRHTKTNNDLMHEYFKKIPKPLAQKLYEMYKVDFDLFGYSKPSFIC